MVTAHTSISGPVERFANFFDEDLLASKIARGFLRKCDLDAFAAHCLEVRESEPAIWKAIAYERARRRAYP